MTTLARLSFWLSAERVDSFEVAYKRQLRPILNKHGLEEQAPCERPSTKGVYSQLFVAETPAAVVEHQRRLQQDATWQQALQALGPTFGSPEGASFPYHFSIYRTPTGSGIAVPVGAGFHQGLWYSLGVKDGLPNLITAIRRDRTGRLWFGTQGRGICRFDGNHFTRFTTADGLATDEVRALLADRQGQLWVGTGGGGLSRFDGQEWTTFTTADGLAANVVWALLTDR